MIFLFLLLLFLSSQTQALSLSNAATNSNSDSDSDRVYLLSIPSLSFTISSLTTARRETPKPQLECIGGDAKDDKKRFPVRVDCYNIGLDESVKGESLPKWHCVAAVHKGVEGKDWKVNCEGYGYEGDAYVLKGSCWLEFQLWYQGEGGIAKHDEDMGEGDDDGRLSQHGRKRERGEHGGFWGWILRVCRWIKWVLWWCVRIALIAGVICLFIYLWRRNSNNEGAGAEAETLLAGER